VAPVVKNPPSNFFQIPFTRHSVIIHQRPISSAIYSLHCTLVYCNRSCLFVCLFVCLWVCGWVCYHDNSKLRASILTKLSLYVKVVTISSWLNFGRPAPPGRRSAAGRKFLAPLCQRAMFASLWAIFSLNVVWHLYKQWQKEFLCSCRWVWGRNLCVNKYMGLTHNDWLQCISYRVSSDRRR